MTGSVAFVGMEMSGALSIANYPKKSETRNNGWLFKILDDGSD
jgi:hypothetical protein